MLNLKSMDTVKHLKKNLITRIKDSKDLNFLNAVQTIFDSSEQELYKLSTEQQLAIGEGKGDIKNRLFFKSDEVISEMRQWLKEK